MASDWTEVTLANHCSKIGSGATPRGGSSVYLEKGDITLIRSQNVYNDGFKRDGLVFITEHSAEKLKNVIVEKDDILLNITGDSVARVCIVDDKVLPARVNQHVAIIRPKSNSFNPLYLRYQLVSPEMQQLLLNYASAGATRNALTKSMIESLSIPKPELAEQKAIAHILGSLDDKIELNRQMNETLEAMAQALFKSWFVDFDPVIDNAIKAGKPIPDELAARAKLRKNIVKKDNPEIQRLFPDEFEFTEELGWIPKGWGTSTLDDLTTELRRGISPKYTENYGVRVVNQRCIRNHSIDYSVCRLNDATVRKVEGRYIEVGDVLVNSTGVGTLGRMAQVFYLDEPAVVDSHVTVVRPNTELIKPYTFGRLMLSIEPLVESMGLGSTGQTELSRVHLGELTVCVPPIKLQKMVENSFSSYANKSSFNIQKNITLTKLRDTLLPKLMSGEIRVSDAAAMVEDA